MRTCPTEHASLEADPHKVLKWYWSYLIVYHWLYTSVLRFSFGVYRTQIDILKMRDKPFLMVDEMLPLLLPALLELFV